MLERPGAYTSAGFAYRRSKLANLLFAYELRRRLGRAGCDTVQVMACTPGFIPQTGLGREGGVVATFLLRWVLDGLLKWIGLVSFTRSVEEGATCEVLCALPEEAVDGGYHRMSREGLLEQIPSSAESYDEDTARRLWEMSAKLTGSPASLAELLSTAPSKGSASLFRCRVANPWPSRTW